jgi:hypothetical protein
MNISLILAHPGPGSFNHAIAETARQTLLRNGHTIFFHDLCAEGFDPILPAREIPKGAAHLPAIARHCAEIAAADGIIVVQWDQAALRSQPRHLPGALRVGSDRRTDQASAVNSWSYDETGYS